MDGSVGSRKWRSLKQRLGFRVIGCCGATWSPRLLPTSSALAEQPQHLTIVEDDQVIITNVNVGGHVPVEQSRTITITSNPADHHRTSNSTTASGIMNLRMALQAERNLRTNVGPAANVKTLMRLIEETDGIDWKCDNRKISDVEAATAAAAGGAGADWVCCVCMERNKGAAFIPCGHTFCRVCSRELWVNRGSCPVCNHSILEILDIF